MLVLEMLPAAQAAELTAELKHCATIGIGAGLTGEAAGSEWVNASLSQGQLSQPASEMCLA